MYEFELDGIAKLMMRDLLEDRRFHAHWLNMSIQLLRNMEIDETGHNFNLSNLGNVLSPTSTKPAIEEMIEEIAHLTHVAVETFLRSGIFAFKHSLLRFSRFRCEKLYDKA